MRPIQVEVRAGTLSYGREGGEPDRELFQLCRVVVNQRIAHEVAKPEQGIVFVFEPLLENTGPLPPKPLTGGRISAIAGSRVGRVTFKGRAGFRTLYSLKIPHI
jgi:hypothetical protein